MIRDLKAWFAHRRLQRAKERLARITAKERARFAAEHPDYERRRKAALKHRPREWAQ